MTIVEKSCNAMEHLPHEIIAAIISFLPFRHRIQCLQLSCSWRRFLLDSPLLWSTLDDPDCDIAQDLLVHKQHIKKDWIEHVDINSLNVDQQRRALDFLVELGCCSLRSISFSYRGQMLDSLKNFLDCTGDSLTLIDATVAPPTQNFLERLFNQCPRLEIIKYVQRQSMARGRLFHDTYAFSQSFVQSRKQLLEQPTAGQDNGQHFKIKAMHLMGVAPIHQFLNGEVHVPRLEYLNIFCPANNRIHRIQQQGWPYLKYLYLSGVHFTSEGVASFTTAITNIPQLVALHISVGSRVTPTNALLMALGDLQHLQELNFYDWRNRRRPTNRNQQEDDEEEQERCLDVEQGLLYLLKGKCRRTLQKLKLRFQGQWTDRILAAIPNDSLQLTCLCLSLQKRNSQPSGIQLDQENHHVCTDIGLRSFAETMSHHKMDFLGLHFDKAIHSETCEFMRDKLGPDFVLTFRDGKNGLNTHFNLSVSENGKWTLNESIYPKKVFPSAYDNVLYYI